MSENLIQVLDPRGQPSGIFGRALMPENDMMDLLNPQGQPETTLQEMSMAERLPTLEGKTVYLVETGFAGAKEFMEEVQDPTRFLVVPKLLASVIVVPFLTLFSSLFGIAGGLLVGVFMLDLTAGAYIAKTVETLTLFDVYWGLLKSAVFALLIAWIGCFRGFRVTGGAASVGQATTSAVVSSIFLIILTDSVFAVILRYWG